MAPQITIVPKVLQTNTLVKNVAWPTCSKTTSTSRPPVAARIALPKRLISSRIRSPVSGSLSRNSRRSITAVAPSSRTSSILSSEETTAIAFAP